MNPLPKGATRGQESVPKKRGSGKPRNSGETSGRMEAGLTPQANGPTRSQQGTRIADACFGAAGAHSAHDVTFAYNDARLPAARQRAIDCVAICQEKQRIARRFA